MSALAGVFVALVALILQPWPARSTPWDAGPQADRGDAQAALAPTIAEGRLSWSPLAGADEYRLELYDESGIPVGSPVAATSPLVLPVEAADGWIRIEARHRGQPLVRSPLVRRLAAGSRPES